MSWNGKPIPGAVRFGVLLMVLGAGATCLASCLSDPRKDEPVKAIVACQLADLGVDPQNPRTSLRAYVETAEELLAAAQQLDVSMQSACNQLNAQLQQAPGVDVLSACAAVSRRIALAEKNEPPRNPGAFGLTHFVDVGFVPSCSAVPGALDACLAKCAGPCDIASACENGKLVGKCSGECLGACEEQGIGAACTGSCRGETTLAGGACNGACVDGTCSAVAWNGTCAGACPSGFAGVCGGTCTGTCDGAAISSANRDGGAPDAAPGPGPQPPPDGDDGNCRGKCAGTCSSAAAGACAQPCLTFGALGTSPAKWVSGFCGTNGSAAAGCNGKCRSSGGSGSAATCSGTCIQVGKKQCTGQCRELNGQKCQGQLSEVVCEGTVACGQNTECNLACQASARIAAAARCAAPAHAEIFAITDPALEAALIANQGVLGKAINQLEQLRTAASFVRGRALGDFSALKLSGDTTNVCFARGKLAADQAQTKIELLANANPFIRR